MVKIIRNGRLVEVATGQAARDARAAEIAAQEKMRREVIASNAQLRGEFLEAIVESRLNRVVSKMIRGK